MTTYTDREFFATLAAHVSKSAPRIRIVLGQSGKFRPRHVATPKGFGQRIMWTSHQLDSAKAYLAEYYGLE
jgi:hypothetical protein